MNKEEKKKLSFIISDHVKRKHKPEREKESNGYFIGFIQSKYQLSKVYDENRVGGKSGAIDIKKGGIGINYKERANSTIDTQNALRKEREVSAPRALARVNQNVWYIKAIDSIKEGGRPLAPSGPEPRRVMRAGKPKGEKKGLKLEKREIPLINYIKKKLGYKEIKWVNTYQFFLIYLDPLVFNKVNIDNLGNKEYSYWLTGYLDASLNWEDLYLKLEVIVKKGATLNERGKNSKSKQPQPNPTKIRFEARSKDYNNLPPFLYINLMKNLDDSIGREEKKECRGGRVFQTQGDKGDRGRVYGLGVKPSGEKVNVEYPKKKIRSILWYLDKYPLISYKYIKYLKFRKIYRISQRKEHLTKKGVLKILSLWRYTGSLGSEGVGT